MFERHLKTQEFLKIPISGSMYSIDINGQIKNLEDEILETTLDADGNITAWLYLWDGWKNYQVAILVAFTFKPTHVPFFNWSKLTVMFKDKDKTNLHPSNLVWKFPIGLESKKYPGYSFIPGFSRYVINKHGEVIKLTDGLKLKLGHNEKGYAIYHITPDIGVSTGIGRHRLLGLAWLEYTADVDKLHINHKNGIPGSDELNNLEWVTPKQNIYHALRTGLKKDGKEILVRHIESGVVTSYYTEAQANDSLGFYRGAIRNNTNIPLNDRKPFMGYDIRLARERLYWSDVNLSPHDDVIESSFGKVGLEDPYSLGLRDDSKKIHVKNIKTGVITNYDSLGKCAKVLSLRIPDVHYRVKYGLIYPGFLQFKDINDLTPWVEFSTEDFTRMEKLWSNVILVRNVKTNEIIEYTCLSECADILNISYANLYHKLSLSDQPIFEGYLQFQRKKYFNDWRNPTDLENEHDEALYGHKVLSKNVLTREIKEYSNATECARDLNLSDLTISVRLRDKGQKVYPGNLQFKRKIDIAPWRDITDKDFDWGDRHYPIKVNVRNIFTDQKYTFDSIQDTIDELGIPFHCIVDRKNRAINHPYFQYELRFNDTAFNEYSENDLEIFRQSIEDKKAFRGRGFKMTNIDTGEVRVFADRYRIVKEFGISKLYISELAKDNLVFRNKWRVSYYFI